MKAVLCLGRNGDIINALPIALKLHQQTGEQIGFIAQKDYAEILDGVSYVCPIIYHGGFAEVGIAFDQFKNEYDIVVAQVYGSCWRNRHLSFVQDMYAQAGFEPHFDKLPLVFDRRDADREAELIGQYIRGITILVNLSGHSSPMRRSGELIAMLMHSWGLKCNTVNLAAVRCHRIYDLIGLYNAADLLITADTATLHLAKASSVPTIEFIVDTPSLWHGSVPTKNCVLSVRYSDIFKQLTKIHSTIASVTHNAERRQNELSAIYDT